MKIKYHIQLNGPELGALVKLLDMIAENNSEKKLHDLEDFYHVCMADKILYPILGKKVKYELDKDDMELLCMNPDTEDIYWVIISCDVYEIKDDDIITDFSQN